ncbi:hypothetical protein ACFVSK_11045 [Cellulosimicrobium cellulans]|uniref:hypothetical protein n=1 Tax=Cellulosimicrobium cellulans TaxID=1710 RepID=UPI0036EDE4F5
MPKPRMQKRTALDVVLGQPAPEIPSTYTENASQGSSVPQLTASTAEASATDVDGVLGDDSVDYVAEGDGKAAMKVVEPELDLEPSGGSIGDISSVEDEVENEQGAPPAEAPLPLTPARTPARDGTAKPRTRRQSAPATSPEETDPRFEPVLGRNDDAALVPFSTRLSPDLRRRLKLYSAVSGESTTSLTNRALDYMLEVSERKVGLR